MNILIAGASGFIGKELTFSLSNEHHITVLGRSLQRLENTFPATIEKITWDNLQQHSAAPYDLIINLSGSNIGEKRWSTAIKNELISSRTTTNQKLIQWLKDQTAKPRYFCANAVGIYGAQPISTAVFDETHPLSLENPEGDFLKEIGLAWENSLKPALEADFRVSTLRFGVVLKKGEGMLKKLELPFRLGLGSIVGSGKQTISWIHYEDMIASIKFLIERPDLSGAFNMTSPLPVTQKEFALTYAKILKRPLLLKTPAWLIKAMFGEMGEYLLLKGQAVIPKRLTDLSFQFKYSTLTSALAREYS